MKESRLKQALHYQLNYFGWSSLYVYGIAIVVIGTIGFFVTTAVNDGYVVNITGIGGVGFVHLLIMGIAGIRSDLRFFIQHGISRRTTYFSHLYGSLICGAALGLFCELFNLISYHWLGFTFYGSAFTIQSFLANWMMYMFTFFFAWQAGALISLIYYRLGKMQQIVFTVTVIALVIFGGSAGIRYFVGFAEGFDNIINRIVESAIGLTSMGIWIGLLFGILAAAGNYLLLRRVQIKE